MMNRIAYILLLAVATLAVSTFSLSAKDTEQDITLLRAVTQHWLDKAKLPEEAAPFAAALLSSSDWQHELQDSGPVEGEATVINDLYQLWKHDPSITNEPVMRSMATALALEGVRRKRSAADSILRYKHFRNGYDYGLLNTLFSKINTFERRYLARGVQHSAFNTPESLDYLVNHFSQPADHYPSICWKAAYRLHNYFGDSIHGPQFYRAFEGCYENHAEMVYKVGGVCGSLSNFGAAAAVSNGVPALSMGEPGHCAYAVMTNLGKWTPAYSLSWKRGTHTSFFGGSWGWHMLNVNAYQSSHTAYASGNLRRLATHQIEQKQISKAAATLKKARVEHPHDWLNWKQSIDLLTEHSSQESDWRDLHDDCLEHLAPLSGEIAWHVLQKHIYPKMLPKNASSSKERAKILLSFHRALDGWGLARWDFTQCLNQQVRLLNGPAKEQDKFMISVFGRHVSQNILTPYVLESHLKTIGDNKNRRTRFIATLAKSLSKGNKEGKFSDVIDTLARQILPNAAKQGDKASFQFIGRLTADNYAAQKDMPAPFPGILLSSGGTLNVSGAGNRYDKPERHWGVIEKHGGRFHTGGKPVSATVQLGNFGRVSGVVIVGTGGWNSRIVNAKLQVSDNGTDWTDVHTFTKAQNVHRIDLKAQKIDAGFVRVIQPNNQPLHFSRFLVYGRKQN